MKYFVTLICFFLLAENAVAQVNLVPNGNFETLDQYGCPNSAGDFIALEDWNLGIGSPDYFHMCGTNGGAVPQNAFGSQPSLDSAYIGIASYTTFFSGGQEAAGVQLISPLQAGVKYRVKLKASYADSANFAVCCVGVRLTQYTPVPTPWPPYSQNISSVELVIPEADFDTTTWFQLDDVYTASGGENTIFVGTFRPDSDLNPVVVRPNGDPNWNVAYFYIDNVEVYEDDLVGVEEEELEIKLTFELISEQLEITSDKPVQLHLMDISGRMVLSEQLNSGRSTISVSSIPNGMYVAVFTSESGQTTSRKIVKVN